jgi:hypothetical protein
MLTPPPGTSGLVAGPEVAHPHRQQRRPEQEMAERSGKTAYPRIGIWFDESAGDIHLSIPGHGLSTINADASSARGNPHLFNKLAKALRDEGKPHPPVIENWKDR